MNTPLKSLATAAVLCLLTTPLHAADACAAEVAAVACQDLGTFTASAMRVQVLKSPAKGARRPGQGLRTLVRIRNHGDDPLVLAHRLGTSRASDENGNLYAFKADDPRRTSGIGLVTRGRADMQFRLERGQARDFWVEASMPYNPKRVTPGQVFTHDFVLVELRATGNDRVELLRDHAVSLPGLQDASAPLKGLANTLDRLTRKP